MRACLHIHLREQHQFAKQKQSVTMEPQTRTCVGRALQVGRRHGRGALGEVQGRGAGPPCVAEYGWTSSVQPHCTWNTDRRTTASSDAKPHAHQRQHGSRLARPERHWPWRKPLLLLGVAVFGVAATWQWPRRPEGSIVLAACSHRRERT